MTTYELNFNKNLGALEEYNPELAQRIESIKTNDRFEVFAGKNVFDTNIYDHVLNEKLYENAEEFFNTKYSEIYNKFERYPVLFFYGLGNGILYKALLKNENHRSIIVFEENLELVYIAFHLIDFSEELEKKRLYILDNDEKNLDDLVMKFLAGELFVKNYIYDSKILPLSPYYEKNASNLKLLEKKLNEKISYIFEAQGSLRNDKFSRTLEQAIQNIPDMLENPSLKTLLNQQKNKNKSAIIVASGPSLIKQLPLLKEVQDKAIIICVDGSYPILYKYDIKPDYVMNLEEHSHASEFFNNDFDDFDKNITFIATTSTHSNTIKYLKQYKRTYILALMPNHKYTHKYLMDEFGSLGGLNVAYMGYEFATKLACKNIILIGQDLAYDEEGNSHPMEFTYGQKCDFELNFKQIPVPAYGGKGEVLTHGAWKSYIQSYELSIKENSKRNITTYNATEGGARIEGAIEIPFKEACEKFFTHEKTKISKLEKLSKKEQIKLAKKSFDHINSLILFAQTKIEECQELLKPVLKVIEKTRTHINLHTLDFEEILKTNDEIHKIKEFLEDEKMSVFSDLLVIALAKIELELARISLMSAHTQDDKKIRMVIWLIKHEEWLNIVIQTLKDQKQIMQESLINLELFIKENDE